jgi:hypothetical protein
MENRDRDKMSQRNSSTKAGDINRGVSKSQSDKSSSADFGQNIGRSENSLNEPSNRTSGSVGSRGMESGSKGSMGSNSNIGSSSSGSKGSSDLGSSDSSWGDSGKGSQSGSRH